MQENLTENKNILLKESDPKMDSGETTYHDEKFPKTVKKDSEKILQIKLLQEKIDNENSIIKEYDTQLENIRNNNQTDLALNKKNIFDRISTNKTNKLKKTRMFLAKQWLTVTVPEPPTMPPTQELFPLKF